MAARQLKIGTLIDRLWKADQAVKAKELEIKKLKAKREEVEDEIYNRFTKDQINGASGRLAKVSLRRSQNGTITDYDALEKYVYRHKALELLQTRVSQKAWKERVANNKGRPIPGIETFERVAISLRKV